MTIEQEKNPSLLNSLREVEALEKKWREDFEGKFSAMYLTKYMDKKESRTYIDERTEECWSIYKTACKAAQVEIDKLDLVCKKKSEHEIELQSQLKDRDQEIERLTANVENYYKREVSACERNLVLRDQLKERDEMIKEAIPWIKLKSMPSVNQRSGWAHRELEWLEKAKEIVNAN